MSKELIEKRVKEIEADAIANGFSQKRIDRANAPGVEGNSLPLSGTFGKYNIGSKGTDFAHFRMTVDGSTDTVSVSNLKIVAPLKGEKAEFGTIAKEGALKGKKYLKGKTINSSFSKHSELELIAHLEGKKFTATPVEVMQLTFNENGYSTDAEAKAALVVKGAYLVTIVD